MKSLERYRSVRRFQEFLRINGLTFACAESCTGGLLSREMTALAGSSDVFWGSAVTYSNEAKTVVLGVPATLIAAEGAVSAAVALAMAQGIADRSGVPLAASITGVAGPGGGTPEKPVGTVWFGLYAARDGRRKTVAVRWRFRGRRAVIQTLAAHWARGLAAVWWESGMDLDSLRTLSDNEKNLFELAQAAPFFSQYP